MEIGNQKRYWGLGSYHLFTYLFIYRLHTINDGTRS
jgi:hypothetical protein